MLELYYGAIVNGLLIGAVYALIATGLNIIFGVMRMVNFAHGEMVVIGMYTGYALWKYAGLSPAFSVPIAGCSMFALGYGFHRIVGNDFISKPQHVQFVLFISLAMIITGLHAIIFGPDPRGIDSADSFAVYRIGALRIDAARLHAALGACAIMAALWVWLRFSLTGKALTAASENIIGGRAIGIPIDHIFSLTMGLGVACAGAAGALIAPLFDTTPYLASEFTLTAFIIVIVGGLASLPGALLGGLLIGAAEALAALLITPSAKSLLSYALRPAAQTRGSAGAEAMIDLDRRHWIAIAAFVCVLASFPIVANDFHLSVLSLVFLYAIVGIAWNLTMGYAGQLSLGHALYFGLGAYVVAIGSERYGVTPWIGMAVAFLMSALCGLAVGTLGFRFGVRGVYFALLTIAFAEAARILFEHWDTVGGTGGYFLSALGASNRPLVSLRGGAVFFYYALFATMLISWTLSAILIGGKLGFKWRAVREDEEAARALGVDAFRVKLIAVAVSAGMTGVAGGWFALINGSLFPDSVLGMRLSIDLIVAPIVGGLGTLFGPILGAFIVLPANELAKELGQASGVNGLNLFIYGLLLLGVVLALPNGCWPWLACRLGLARQDKTDGAP